MTSASSPTNIMQLIITSRNQVQMMVIYYIMAGHAIVVVKDITLLFYHGNAVILTLW